MSVNGLSPVQCKMMELLSDCLPHTVQELMGCLWDELGPPTNLEPHLAAIRKFIRPRGEDIGLERSFGETRYRLVRRIVKS